VAVAEAASMMGILSSPIFSTVVGKTRCFFAEVIFLLASPPELVELIM
jgi:hypothetical protein